jgi:hypothetical protein
VYSLLNSVSFALFPGFLVGRPYLLIDTSLPTLVGTGAALHVTPANAGLTGAATLMPASARGLGRLRGCCTALSRFAGDGRQTSRTPSGRLWVWTLRTGANPRPEQTAICRWAEPTALVQFTGSPVLRAVGRFEGGAMVWCYLYPAIDRTGALVDVMLSETRDIAAAETSGGPGCHHPGEAEDRRSAVA